MEKKRKKILSLLMLVIFVLCFAGTAFAETPDAADQYFFCEEGLLDEESAKILNDQAALVSEKHESGVYMVMVSDYTQWSYDLNDAAEYIYEKGNMGLRADQDGIMLLLSMEERDYILLSHGSFASQAYSDYAKDVMAEDFLDDFGEDDYVGGFSDYIESCDELLSMAAAGTPLSRESNPSYKALKWLFSLILGVVIGLIVAAVVRSRMRTVAKKVFADQYLEDGGGQITKRQDLFTHMTQTRRKIEKPSSSGGSGGGFSSSIGKF